MACTDRIPVSTSEEDISHTQIQQQVYKKSAQNNKMTLYLANRDIIISNKCAPHKIYGVVYVHPDFVQDKKIYGQVTLTFRYGREDEEVMGLKFCNEAVMSIGQLHPIIPDDQHQQQPLTPLQEALCRRLGVNAHAFVLEITPMAPPSIQLVPAKEYNGAPIGTSYDVRTFIGDKPDEKQQKRNVVRMGIRIIQLLSSPSSGISTLKPNACITASYTNTDNENATDKNAPPPPRATINKQLFLLGGRSTSNEGGHGKVKLDASLDKSIYTHGDRITVRVFICNNSNKTVRQIQISVIQHVDVCMFSNGKFKNTVALMESSEDCPIGKGTTIERQYTLKPAKGVTKNWIALEDSSYDIIKSSSSSVDRPPRLASTVLCNSVEERNVFAIYVSYYVKVKIIFGTHIRRTLSVKLPFILTHSGHPSSSTSTSSLQQEISVQSTNITESSGITESSIITDNPIT